MIQPSVLYSETLKQKTQIAKDFNAIKAVSFFCFMVQY